MTSDQSLITQPIFLVGAERSGTTVLRLMLDHHPQIAWCSEFEYAVDRISDTGQWPNIDAYHQWLAKQRIFLAPGFKLDRSLTYPQLVNSFLVQKRDRDHKPIVGATVHRHFDNVLSIWPDARFIHIVRDGRDVARSCIGMGWAGNVWTGVQRWVEAERLWATFSDEVPADRKIEITYETLISEPVEVLTRLCDFIGVPYDEAMLSYSEKTTYNLPDPTFTQQWRRKLSDPEIQLVESQIATMLQERGYELSGLPIISISALTARRLKFQDWWYRWNFRRQRYGWPLFVADYLSRHLNVEPWQKHVRQNIMAIETRHLK
jgi:hypothetical protein